MHTFLRHNVSGKLIIFVTQERQKRRRIAVLIVYVPMKTENMNVTRAYRGDIIERFPFRCRQGFESAWVRMDGGCDKTSSIRIGTRSGPPSMGTAIVLVQGAKE